MPEGSINERRQQPSAGSAGADYTQILEEAGESNPRRLGPLLAVGMLVLAAAGVLGLYSSQTAAIFHRGAPSTSQTTNLEEESASQNVCKTKRCLDIADRMHQVMDFSADVCEDPYRFFCGKWMDTYRLPESESIWTIGFSLTFEEMFQREEKVLKAMTCSEAKAKHKEDPEATDRWDVYMACVFDTCMRAEEWETANPQLAQSTLKSALLSRFPFLAETNVPVDAAEGRQVFTRRLAEMLATKIEVFVGVETDRNGRLEDDTDLYMRFRQPGLLLPYKAFKEPKMISDLTAYVHRIMELGDRWFPDSCASKVLSLKERAEAVVDVENKIRNIEISPEVQRDPLLTTFNMSWSAICGDVEAVVDCELLLKEIRLIFGPNTLQWSPDHIVSVESMHFFKRMADLVYDLPWHVVDDYLRVKIFTTFGDALTTEWREEVDKWNAKSTGITQLKRAVRCRTLMETQLTWLLGRGILRGDKDNFIHRKKTAAAIVPEIRVAFRNALSNASWMDEVTRTTALKKFDAMKTEVSYPEWVFDNAASNTKLGLMYGLDDFELTQQQNPPFPSFHAVEAKEPNFLETTIEIFQSNARYNVGRDSGPDDNEIWGMGPEEANAVYYPYRNKFELPASVTLEPFLYAPDEDSSHIEQLMWKTLTLGASGATICHETMHGFDDVGRTYDDKGILRNWWSKEAFTLHTQQEQCVAEQYSQYGLDLKIDGQETKVYLSGALTVGENLADNGGLQVAYQTLLNSLTEEEKRVKPLPGVDLTMLQLFFAQFGYMWCEKATDEFNYVHALTNPHSPGMFRIIGVLQNHQGLQDAFSCPLPARFRFGSDPQLLRRGQPRTCTVW